MSRLSWLFAPSISNVSFALRCCLSVAIALYLAFWLQLDNAYWAFINVAILIQPLPGFLVVRGFARLTGTAVAGVVSIVLIALFAQSYVLFSAGLIAWVGICVFFASLFRNNMAYGFVLAGYVTSIIAVRSMPDPTTVFDVAVARTAETALAVVVSASVSVILAPSTTARAYFRARLEAFRAVGAQFLRLDRNPGEGGDPTGAGNTRSTGDETPHAGLHELVEKTLALEQTRQYARFDAPGFAEHDRLARRVDYELLSLVSAMASLQVYLAKFGDRIDRTPLKELDQAAQLMQRDPGDTQPIKQAFGHAYNSILNAARQGTADRRKRSLVDWVVISRALDLANRARAAVIKHGMLVSERSSRQKVRRDSEFSVSVDIRSALRNTLRAAVAMTCGAAIWATHDEPALAGMMVLLSVFTTLFALGDTPVANARGFAIGAACAAFFAFFADFVFLPQANSYATLMIVVMPVVFVGALAMATPALALSGRIFVVIFGLLIHPSNVGRTNFVTFAENLLGVALAIILAVTAFSLILPITPRQRLRERLAGVFGELAKGFAGERERFETRVYDRLLQLPVNAVGNNDTHVSARQAAFAAVNMGVEARSLRVLATRVQFPDRLEAEITGVLADLQALFDAGYPAVADVFAMQARANRLAQDMLDQAVVIDHRRRRRFGIRAAVAAELLSAALADYGLARRGAEDPGFQLGGISDVA
ncbi:FUSC family protein [Salinisphaera aquimarina]